MFQPNKAKSEKQSVVLHHHSDDAPPPPIFLKNGPNPIRKCTDLFCCFIFLGIIGGLGYFLTMAFLQGDIKTLGHPMDSDGNLCGVGKSSEYQYIYFVTPDQRYLYRTVCVASCPTGVTDASNYNLKCFPNSSTKDCKYNPSPQDPSQSVQIYDTVPMADSICKPVNTDQFNAVEPAIVVGCSFTAMNNIKMALPIIGASAGITFLLALVFTCLLTFLTTCMTWIFLIVYIAFTGLAGTICFFSATNMEIPLLDGRFAIHNGKSLSEGYNPFLLAAAIVFWLLCMNSLFTVLWRFTKIKFMISVIKLSTEFVGKNKSIILIPLFAFAIVMTLIGLFFLGALYILSEQKIVANTQYHVTPFQRLLPQPMQTIQIGLVFLGLFWVRTYIVNLAHFLVASTSVLWYLTANQNKTSGKWMLWQTFTNALLYHNGSVAAGSFYLWFFEPMAHVFNTIFDPLQKYRYRRDNLLLHYLTKCIICCCCCCEKWVMYINKQAYAEVYMLSEGFCASSTAAYYTLHHNMNDFKLLSGLGDSFTHFSKVFLFLVTSIGCWWYMIFVPPFSQILDQPIYPAILIAFVSLSTSTLFMEMFGQSGDSLLLAYFTDLEVERIHFGREECATCPEEIKNIVHHLRQKQRKYYG